MLWLLRLWHLPNGRGMDVGCVPQDHSYETITIRYEVRHRWRQTDKSYCSIRTITAILAARLVQNVSRPPWGEPTGEPFA